MDAKLYYDKAPSNKSKCKLCKEKFQKDDDRLVQVEKSAFGGDLVKVNYHASCFLKELEGTISAVFKSTSQVDSPTKDRINSFQEFIRDLFKDSSSIDEQGQPPTPKSDGAEELNTDAGQNEVAVDSTEDPPPPEKKDKKKKKPKKRKEEEIDEEKEDEQTPTLGRDIIDEVLTPEESSQDKKKKERKKKNKKVE